MIDREHKLAIKRQADLLGINRGSVYYKPVAIDPETQHLMHRIDRLHLAHPFAGARMLRDLLRQEGLNVGRKHVSTLMKRMGIEALYRRPRTTKPAPGHKVYPYLLRGVSVSRANQAWAMDITYIPMREGFLYLVAVVDWYSRRVLSWQLSNTMDVSFCLEALTEAMAKYGLPEIVNTDQGSQFTSVAFTGLLQTQGIQISMDGKGAWRDNVFVERLWRSVKYEDIYLYGYNDPAEVRQGLQKYFEFYNTRRPHRAHDGHTPDRVYFNSLPATLAA